MSLRYFLFLAVLGSASLFACTTAQPPSQETTKTKKVGEAAVGPISRSDVVSGDLRAR
jgi:hypothetical protein